MTEVIEHLKVYRNFISEEERQDLKNHAADLFDRKLFRPEGWYTQQKQLSEPTRFRFRLHPYCTSTWHPTIDVVAKRIIKTLDVKEYYVDPYYGFLLHYMLPGSEIQVHCDRYFAEDVGEYMVNHCAHVRFNVMVNRDKSNTYSPHISPDFEPDPAKSGVPKNKELKYVNPLVNQRDAWAFPASKYPHGTPVLIGSEPRIVYQFGFAIPK